MLQRNEQEPPRIHKALSVLGGDTIPVIVHDRLQKSDEFLEHCVQASQEANDRHLVSMQDTLQQATDQVAALVQRSQAQIMDTMEERLSQTKQELNALQEAVAQTIPATVTTIVGHAHDSSVQSLSAKFESSSSEVKSMESTLQDQLPAMVQDSMKDTETTILGALSTNTEQVKAIEESIEQRLPAVVKEVMDRTHQDIQSAIDGLHRQVPQLVQAAVTQSQEDMLTSLAEKLRKSNEEMRKEMLRSLSEQFEARQEELDVKLASQLSTIIYTINQPKGSLGHLP